MMPSPYPSPKSKVEETLSGPISEEGYGTTIKPISGEINPGYIREVAQKQNIYKDASHESFIKVSVKNNVSILIKMTDDIGGRLEQIKDWLSFCDNQSLTLEPYKEELAKLKLKYQTHIKTIDYLILLADKKVQNISKNGQQNERAPLDYFRDLLLNIMRDWANSPEGNKIVSLSSEEKYTPKIIYELIENDSNTRQEFLEAFIYHVFYFYIDFLEKDSKK